MQNAKFGGNTWRCDWWRGFFILCYFFYAKRSNQERAKKTMLQRTSRPHPRRFFGPTLKEVLDDFVCSYTLLH